MNNVLEAVRNDCSSFDNDVDMRGYTVLTNVFGLSFITFQTPKSMFKARGIKIASSKEPGKSSK